MKDLHFEALIRLYLLGKRIKSLAKQHNYDQISRAYVLWQLQKESLSISDLAKIAGIKPSAMSEKIRLMESEGLIKEIDDEDKRKRSFGLTNAGLRKWESIKNKIGHKCEHNHFGLSVKEINELLTILGKINLECV